jgi:hypothetical protein
MPLTLIDNNTTLVNDTGGEQVLASHTPTDYDVYVLLLDIDALAGAEEIDVRCYVDYGGGLRKTVDVTLVAGTNPDGWQSDPIVAIEALDIEWRVEPTGWAADRNIVWSLLKV